MNTVATLHISSSSSDATESLAAQLGSKLRGGETIELVSDLGGGKTTFTRGLVQGAGSSDKVSSPTFTISREYKTPIFTVAHFDFYRLGEAGIVADELAEIIGDKAYVVVVEWGDIVHDVLPEARITISITLVGENDRELAISYPESLAYAVEGLQ